MTLFDFARNNVKRDRRNYIYYFVNCIFSVFVFFLFTVLSFHPAMSVIDDHSTMGLILMLGEAISIGFSICFITYSVSCFLKTRSRQFAIITILGASKKQLNRLIFLENVIVGAVSLIAGILLGLVFSKLFLDVANRVIGVSDFSFYFPMTAILVTVIVLGLVFLAIAIFTPKLVRKKEIIRLLKAEVTGEKHQKLFPLLITFSVSAIFMIWVFTSGSRPAKAFQENVLFIFVLALTVIEGTYLLFAYGMRLSLALGKNSSAKCRLIYQSDKKAKLRVNARTMTISAVLYAISFFSVIVLFSLSGNVKAETEKIMPYAASFNAWSQEADVSHDLSVIEGELKNLPGYKKTEFSLYYPEGSSSRDAIMSVQSYNLLMEFLGRETVVLEEDEIYLVPGNAGKTVEHIPAGIQSVLEEKGFDLHTAGNADTGIVLSGFTNSVSVISDAVFDSLKPELESKTIYAFNYDNWEQNSESPKAIETALKSDLEEGEVNFISAYRYYRTSQLQNNLTLYIGSMLCFTFILAVASFIYSRLYSEIDAECRRYRGIVKIGLSRKELASILNRIIFMILWTPFIVALIYLWIGIMISEHFSIISNIPTALGCTAVLVILQTILYFIINRAYRKAVFQKVYGNNRSI